MLEQIEECVCRGDAHHLGDILSRGASSTGITPSSLIKALTRGMERSREGLKGARLSVPEFLFSIDAFREGIEWMRQAGLEFPDPGASVLIGVVEGEVHDLGKNIVAAVLEASGFRVIDLGRQMSRDYALEAIEQHKPSVVALSAMMSTCIAGMKEVITWIRKLHPETRILVGGAALDADLAASIGAHGYAESAATVTDEAIRLMHTL
jgi:5-methyltetrahydrofolate--homocysteine methyltransferase